MFNMRIARRTLPLMLVALATTGCAPALHSVRVRTAEGREWTAVPRPQPPVTITEEELQRATVALAGNVVPVEDPLEHARQLFELPVRSGWFFYDRRTKQIRPLDPGAAADFLPAEVVELTRNYLQWCHNRQQPGDCLRLLRHGYGLDADARLAVAMRIALGSVMEAIAASLADLANGEAVCAMIVSTAVMVGMLIVVPEPITKLIAATMTAALVVYLGVDTIYSLRDGWRRLVARTDAAGTFDELRSAGEQFGKLMGANAARVLVMVAAAAVGGRAGDVAKVLPKLTGAGQVLRFVTAEGVEVQVEAVQTAIIAKSGITLTLAPGAAVASTIENENGGSDPGPRRPSREERIAELMKDKDRAEDVNGDTVRRQAEVAADMEEQGRLKGPVRQPVEGDGHSGDFIDGNEQDWDVKRPHSRAQVEENRRISAIRKGRPPPKFDPKTPLEGEFDLKKLMGKIHEEFKAGENVIIDTSKLNDADLAALRQALIDEGILGAKVLMYP